MRTARELHRVGILAAALGLGAIVGARTDGAAAAAGAAAAPEIPASALAAGEAIDGERLHGDVAFLADDMLEGRGTGTRGYDLAARYVANRFATLGLAPGGSDGYLQPVPFLCATNVGDKSSLALIGADGHERPLELDPTRCSPPTCCRPIAASRRRSPTSATGSARPSSATTTAGVDVRGKVVVEFRGAPPAFDHDQRAFYSNSIEKARMAAEHGAVGMIGAVRPSEQERQPFSRSVTYNRIESCKWTDERGVPTSTQEQLHLGGSLSPSGVAAVFAGAPIPFAQAGALADASKVRSFALPGRLRAHRTTAQRTTTSSNVVGILRGSDPALAGEAIVVTAHSTTSASARRATATRSTTAPTTTPAARR